MQLNVGQAHRRFNCNAASCICGSGQVDENGMYTGEFETFALAGFIRARGESDACSWCCTWQSCASDLPSPGALTICSKIGVWLPLTPAPLREFGKVLYHHLVHVLLLSD